MRDNNTVQYYQGQNPSNYRPSYPIGQSVQLIRSPQNKVYIANNPSEKPQYFPQQQQKERNFNPNLRFDSKGNGTVNQPKDIQFNLNGVTSPINGSLKRKNIQPLTKTKQLNGEHETQKEVDLRGTCPNIFRKLQHSGLRNTMHINNTLKNNIQEFEKKNEIQGQNLSGLNFQKNSAVNTYGFGHINSPVSTSLVLEGEEKDKEKVKNESTKSTIQTVKSSQGLNNKTHFTTLNQIIFNKDMKKSLGNQKSLVEKSKVIHGFQLGKILGKGKFGEVYLARHQSTGFVVALKRIAKSKIKQYKMVQQLKEEIKLHSALIHPNIVRFYGLFEEQDDLYLILQYMNGGTLFDYLAEKQRLTVKESVDFLRDTILAVQHLHEMSVAHRDIKPQNIVLSTEGVAKLCDFGWSALVQNSRKTYCGTFDYAPPQILQRKNYDASVDIWCIGVLTYELLTGRVPFEGEVRNIVMSKIINVDKNKIDYPPQVPQIARQFIQSLVRKEPSQRPKCKELLKYQLFVQNPRKTKKNDIK